MVSTSSMKLSTVVPATMTGGQNKAHELTTKDLAMKLHYIKGVYFFNSEAVEGLTIYDLKAPMFQLLQLYFIASGRIRRHPETGRPFIRCNDGGVRIVEAYCEESVDEWLAMAMAMEDSSLFDGLSYGQPLGPDLGFSPLVFLQFTWFKCGGMSLGLSWANVVGDAFSASAFINMWGKIMAGHVPVKSLHVPDPEKSQLSIHPMKPCNNSCLKMVVSVGEYWLAPNSHKMRTHTFHVSAKKLDHLLSNQQSKFSAFEILSSIIWKALSKIKENSKETRMVTICTRNSREIMEFKFPSNGMVFDVVEADFVVAEADVAELAELILDTRAEEDGGEVAAGREEGEDNLDFIAYGARLTFVNLEEVEIYGLELKGQKPVYANYTINGVGDEGVVLVLPGPKGGRLVTAVLPENELAPLRNELEGDWSLA